MGSDVRVPPGRPFVHLNCAVSADGRLAYAGGRRALLSGPEDLVRVQELRSRLDAILVGVGTVVADDPSLRVHWDQLGRAPGADPLRVVLDTNGRTPSAARVLTAPPTTLIATAGDCRREFPPSVQVYRRGVGAVDLGALLGELGRREIRSVLVEGGARVLSSFLRGGLYDTLTVYVAPVVIGGTTAPTMVAGPETRGPDDSVRLRLVSSSRLGAGVLHEYAPG